MNTRTIFFSLAGLIAMILAEQCDIADDTISCVTTEGDAGIFVCPSWNETQLKADEGGRRLWGNVGGIRGGITTDNADSSTSSSGGSVFRGSFAGARRESFSRTVCIPVDSLENVGNRRLWSFWRGRDDSSWFNFGNSGNGGSQNGCVCCDGVCPVQLICGCPCDITYRDGTVDAGAGMMVTVIRSDGTLVNKCTRELYADDGSASCVADCRDGTDDNLDDGGEEASPTLVGDNLDDASQGPTEDPTYVPTENGEATEAQTKFWEGNNQNQGEVGQEVASNFFEDP